MERAVVAVRIVFATVAIGAGIGHARVVSQPVRGDAQIRVHQAIPFLSSSSTPAFVSADLVIPRATTKDIARYQRAAGGPAAARWLCDAYTLPLGIGSLQELANAAAAHGPLGINAADALVCPAVRRNVRSWRQRLEGCSSGSILFPFEDSGCHTVQYTVMSHDLAHRLCDATDEQRRSLEVATCQRVLLGRSGRATALRFFTRHAARKRGCLQLRLVPDGIQLYATRRCP